MTARDLASILAFCCCEYYGKPPMTETQHLENRLDVGDGRKAEVSFIKCVHFIVWDNGLLTEGLISECDELIDMSSILHRLLMDKIGSVRERGQGWPEQRGELMVTFTKTMRMMGSKITREGLYLVILRPLWTIQWSCQVDSGYKAVERRVIRVGLKLWGGYLQRHGWAKAVSQWDQPEKEKQHILTHMCGI